MWGGRGSLLNTQNDTVLCFSPSADYDDVVSLSILQRWWRSLAKRGEGQKSGGEKRGGYRTLGLNFPLPFLASGIRGKSSPLGSQLGSFPLLCAHHQRFDRLTFRASAYRYAFNGVGVALGGLLGFGIGHIKGALQSWAYEFIVIGALCSGWAIALCRLPCSPTSCVRPHF